MVDTLNIPQLLKLLKGLKSYPKGTPGHGVYIESLPMIINRPKEGSEMVHKI